MPILIINAPKLVYQPVLIESPLRPGYPAWVKFGNKKAARRRLLLALNPRKSSLGVLLAPPRLVQADLLSLDLASVAGDQSGLAQKRLERGIELYERASQTVAHGSRLPEFPPARYVDHDVELAQLVGQYERLTHDHLPRLAREILVRRTVVHDEIALAGLDEHARDGTLAPAGSVVVLPDHASTSSVLGCCAACGCSP